MTNNQFNHNGSKLSLLSKTLISEVTVGQNAVHKNTLYKTFDIHCWSNIGWLPCFKKQLRLNSDRKSWAILYQPSGITYSTLAAGVSQNAGINPLFCAFLIRILALSISMKIFCFSNFQLFQHLTIADFYGLLVSFLFHRTVQIFKSVTIFTYY